MSADAGRVETAPRRRSDRRLTIGELASRTGASRRSLRHPDAVGLLPADRAPNGYRSYGPDTVELVRIITAVLGTAGEVSHVVDARAGGDHRCTLRS
jgi:MerR-like DNA binding protein